MLALNEVRITDFFFIVKLNLIIFFLPEPHLLIMEFAMRGRLLSLLRAARNSVNIPPSVQCVRTIINPLAPRQLAGFAHDIARGMEYIAEKKVIYIPKLCHYLY